VLAAILAAGVLAQPLPPVTPPAVGLAGAIREPRVLAGAWLMTLAALFYGTFAVLTPLRLDDLGLTATAVGAVFLGAAISEALASPFVGRLSDRRGRLVPVRLGLIGIVVSCVLLPLPDSGAVLAGVALVAAGLLGILWAPATALMSDGAELAGLPQAMAFGVINLAWAGGAVTGAGGGSALADLTADAVPYAVLGVVALATLAAVVIRGRRLQASMPRASRAADSAASS
jgi:MFS family permease